MLRAAAASRRACARAVAADARRRMAAKPIGGDSAETVSGGCAVASNGV